MSPVRKVAEAVEEGNHERGRGKKRPGRISSRRVGRVPIRWRNGSILELRSRSSLQMGSVTPVNQGPSLRQAGDRTQERRRSPSQVGPMRPPQRRHRHRPPPS